MYGNLETESLICMNPSNPANGAEMILHDTGGDSRLRIGSTSNEEVGIGVQYNSAYFLNVGGVSNFNQARVATDSEVIGDLDLPVQQVIYKFQQRVWTFIEVQVIVLIH